MADKAKAMDLTTVHQGVNKRRPKTRVGRGIGSGHGKTSSRGYKGRGSRAGTRSYSELYAGGQMPLIRRIPKRGFSNETWRNTYIEVNLRDIEAKFDTGAVIDHASLREAGLANGAGDGIRILGTGEITKKFKVKVHGISEPARKKIEAAGGSVELIPPPKKPVKNKMKPRPAKVK
ncbi:MAG TPA: 50S ribosomal protein L15 [Gemmatales bacterium]|nr:50S ribosomal protein L15 [Gemmatales bacterium]HMP15614.1 50S ribosomal protein L15 [Gemmatales bacterium]